ncbi:MAG TPA: phosphate ABC transporter, permease protein PstA, partial [Dielma fastidiosa]|nr:phosphate ABC transporter, permease protein PstA [Dielma fastidiosa]
MIRENRRSSKVSDGLLNGITYLSSLISVTVLISIFIFIFSKGSSLISFDLLKNDYWSKNYLVEVKTEVNHSGSFTAPDDLTPQASFSEKWGIAFVDALSNDKHELVLVEYIDPLSPFAHTIDKSAGANKGLDLTLEVGVQIEKIDFKRLDGSADFAGNLASQN